MSVRDHRDQNHGVRFHQVPQEVPNLLRERFGFPDQELISRCLRIVNIFLAINRLFEEIVILVLLLLLGEVVIIWLPSGLIHLLEWGCLLCHLIVLQSSDEIMEFRNFVRGEVLLQIP